LNTVNVNMSQEVTDGWSMEVITRHSRPVKEGTMTESKLELFCKHHTKR